MKKKAFQLSPAAEALLKSYSAVPSEHQHLIAASDRELLQFVEIDEPLQETEVRSIRKLSPEEQGRLEGKLHFMRFFGDSLENLITADDGELNKTLARARTDDRSVQTIIEKTVDTTIDRVLAALRRGDSRPLSVLEAGLTNSGNGTSSIQALARRIEPENYDPMIVAFVKSFADGDKSGMRRSVRELLAERRAHSDNLNGL